MYICNIKYFDIMDKKEFRLHKESGLYVARDGEVFVPQSGKHPAHYTFGYKNKYGYRVVRFKGKDYSVHRLVAECYIPNNDGKPCIDHIIPVSDGGTNDVSNLRWCTYPENNNNPLSKQKKKEKAYKKAVIGTHKGTGYTVEFESAKDAWLTLNINQGHIGECCQGKRKSAGGYYWSYLT